MTRELYGYRLRPHQARILDYAGGRMAVSAVPGSGKTLVLALLAAQLIVEGRLGDEGEVLVVTVQNTAVNNIAQRIRDILIGLDLPPVGYRVCTLHKLGSDIVRQRSDLAGVEERFTIVDGAESSRLMTSAARVWIAENRALWESYLPESDAAAGGDGSTYAQKRWQDEIERVGQGVTKLCKQQRRSPEEMRRLLGDGHDNAFVTMGVDLYARYEEYLRTRSGLDFDDLIWRAIDALEQDDTFLAHLQRRWPYVLEDEAQDSSPLQERILEQISAGSGNWVRVGDPNQAINSTFTSADPRYFRQFLRREDVSVLDLPESGRSAPKIIRLANHLVDWSCAEHPEESVRELAFRQQMIRPTSQGDSQRNPEDAESAIYLRARPFPDLDTEAVEIARWVTDLAGREPQATLAVLCPTNYQGHKVVEALDRVEGAPEVDDMLRSTPQTRSVARVLHAALRYVSDPSSSSTLAGLYVALVHFFRGDSSASAPIGKARRQRGTLLRSVRPQDLLFPRTTASLDDILPNRADVTDADIAALKEFADWAARWVRAADLPVDQLLLTVGQDVFRHVEDLAICHSVASSLRVHGDMHPEWRLREHAEELGHVARNQRSLTGLSLADAGYQAQPGRVAVTTLHKSKGLEWDAVYLICMSRREFPDRLEDAFRDQLDVIGGLSPALEARYTLQRLIGVGHADEQNVIDAAHLEYIAERLRLLYVGITRAKRYLCITCNAGGSRRGQSEASPMPAALHALRSAIT